MESLLFTPASLLALFTQIKELEDYDLQITETIDGKIQLQVGESIYEIEPESAVDVEVDEQDVDNVEDLNLSTYQDLEDSGEIEITEPIEAGIIKELAKTLLVGGMVRLGAKALKN